MPLYEYAPILATHEEARECCSFEVLQKINEAPLTVCPQCGHKIQRILSLFATSMAESSDKKSPTLPTMKATPDARTATPAGGAFTSDSQAGRVARLTMKHVCTAMCRH